MRNSYKYKPSFYRRHWFIGSLIALVIAAAVAGGVAYGFHLHLQAKAALLDMSELGKMESASTIFDRTGATFGYIYEEKREPVPLAQMAVDLQHAVVSAEDNRFYTHNGSDPRGILRAAYQNLRGSRVRQGGSTITQQLARNTFPLGGRTFSRKILEIYVAHRIETALTKDQIMEYYLNRIYLGSGLYGVEAASKGYFGRHASELSLGEAATLAGLINSPNNKSPWHDKRAAKNARDTVLSRMLDEQYITREQYETAQAEELAVKPRVLASSDSYAMEAIRQQVIAQVGLDRAVSEGLKIYTTIDARVQQQAEAALRAQLDEVERNPAFQNHQTYAQYAAQFHDEEKKLAQAPTGDTDAQQPSIHSVVANPEYLQGALIAINNADGGVIALVGGRDFRHSEFNRAMNPRARRPVGTAFTPLVYAAAYQKGIFPGRLFLDQVLDNRQVMVGGQNGILGEWGVERAGNRYDGPIPAGLALIEGKNAATVRVGNETGLDNVLALAKRAGINSPLREFPATFLGSSEVTLGELALAYTGFPNGGWRPAAPYILSEIKDADGNVLFQSKPGPRVRIVDVGPAYQVHNELAQVLKAGSGATAYSRYGLNKTMPAGGKPGTAYNFTDALFAGYNSEVTCAVWAGFDKPSMIYRGAFGSQVALPVWVSVMNAAAQVMPPKEIAVPGSLKKVEICTESGELATDRCYETVDGERHRTTFTTYATREEMPTRTCPVHGGGRSSIGEYVASRTGPSNVVPVSKPATDPNAPRVAKAQGVANLDAVKPVQIKEPTVLEAGDHDPYDAVRPVQENGNRNQTPADEATALNKSPEVTAPTPASGGTVEKKVLRATAVDPNEQEASSLPTVKIDPPQPLEFN